MNSTNEENYIWRYCTIGGMTRVDINSGEDIAHLDELDQKKWTVLSCPVKGLEFDSETLRLLDRDNDGRIQVKEVIATAKWLTSILLNTDLLIFSKSSVAIADLNTNTAEGAKMIAAAQEVFDIIKKENKSEITSDDVAQALAILQEKQGNQLPYGEDSDAAAELVGKLKAKVDDYFARCALAAFNTESSSKLDVNPDRIAAISDRNVAQCMDEVASYPLAHISADGLLPLSGQINPAWQSDFNAFKAVALDKDFPGVISITKAQWDSVVAKVNAYSDSKNSARKKDSEQIVELANFLRLTRNFYRFLRNYVTFSDFYSRNENTPAVFQAGKLYIDQRCCELCIEVSDMAAHNDSAALSGMYLIYCDCKSIKLGKSRSIVAVMTRGDVDNLRKGKNALFYDRDGEAWDATVTKIIDNPISIKQAFLSPYKKLWSWVTEKINKSATEKEAKSFENLTSKVEENAEAINKGNGPDSTKKDPKQVFDIAKFAGIFAAIGMAIGYISKALVDIAEGVSTHWYNLPLLIILIILVISGPSMFLAWTKLRKRNLAPVLNANGWAINAASLVNVSFGSTLTSQAKYPGLELVDPIAAKQFKANRKKRIFYTIVIAFIAIFAILYFTNTLAPIGLPW